MTDQPTISVWVPGDQLLAEHPAITEALLRTDKQHIIVVMIESTSRIRKLRYHRKKLVLLLSAMRHYGERLREQGFQVEYRNGDDFLGVLQQHLATVRPDQLLMMAAAEYETRSLQYDLAATVGASLTVLPNTQFLVEKYDPFPDPNPDKRYVMETFYRRMRHHFDILLDQDGEPEGGQWNFDKDNRKKLPKGHQPPAVIAFEPDEITQQVIEDVNALDHGVGTTDGFALAVTHEEVQQALDDFVANRLHDFGAYEDAMSSQHALIYHSMLSLYANIGLVTPMQMIKPVIAAYRAGDAPINSVEGFIRQVIGWREFIYWQYWQQMPALREANSWSAERSMPQMFWDAQTDMNCIRHVVERLLSDGYNHHIERLMVICNFCLLIGVEPAEVADWFLQFYVDAYEWVVYPNVIGMGLNADGGKTATKPYIASANYINKMGDYCKGCRYEHAQRTGDDACPFNYLYWNFVMEHEETLRANPRLGRSVFNLDRISKEEQMQIRQQAADFMDGLSYYES